MACLDDALTRRLVTLSLGLGTAVATPSAVVDRCNGLGKTPVQVVFRDDIEPRSATLQVGQQRVLLIAQPAGSGSRDAAPGVSFWEHHGEAAMRCQGRRFTCRAG